MPTSSGLFPRNFKKTFPIATRGEGCWIIADDGRRFLDASGQAAVVTIGHGVPEIGRAMAGQSSQIAFAHTSQFHTTAAETLASRLLAMAPPNFRNGGRVYFTSGGSEATETAIKLAHIAPCFCYHCPFDKTFPQCELACADDLQAHLGGQARDQAAAFIFEPVVGATLGSAVPPEGYAARITEICRKNGILLIADEIMTGMGRTGKPFAVQHWSVEPDMILVGKGIASGYAPLGAVLASARVVEAFERGSGGFLHGFTYQAHPVSTAAGNAVLDYLEAHKLFDRVNAAGQELRCALPLLQSHPNVGEVRGLGLLLGVEFVKNKATRQTFPREQNIAEKIRQACLEEGVLTYPTQGCVDGLRGDHILLAPPFTISTAECSLIARALLAAAARVFSS